jgi:signal transduction histidine kinase
MHGPNQALAARAGSSPRAWFEPGLSARLLLLTIGFVMLAEVLIYVPSIANFRHNWLADRIASAQTAALALEAAPAGMVPPGLEKRLLHQVGAATVAVRSGGARRLLAISDMPPMVSYDVDLRAIGTMALAVGAFDTLLAREPRFIRVVGDGSGDAEFVEIVMDETPLRQAMLAYSINVLALSLIISGITALLVYGALHKMIVRPVRKLTSAIVAFEDNPDDPGRVIQPTARRDEIGLAEHALARMQASLARELREKKHLAALGLAVSKINHDLRNMLASAQLFSDRIAATADPTAQRLGPKLIAALDRAIGFASSTLAYGRAVEPAPKRRPVLLRPLAEEAGELLGLGPQGGVDFEVDVPGNLVVNADPEQLSRVLVNLVRNAVQVLSAQAAPVAAAPHAALTQAQATPPSLTSSIAPEAGLPPAAAPHAGTIRISARRARGQVTIRVADTGPGVPARTRERGFRFAFAAWSRY